MASMSSRWIAVMKVAWVGLSVLFLVNQIIALGSVEPSKRHEVELAFVFVMNVLTFPAGLLLTAILSGALWLMYRCCGLTVSVSAFGLVLLWVAYVGIGALQWFLIAPALVKKFRARHSRVDQVDGSSTVVT
jgi:hypothetical protein